MESFGLDLSLLFELGDDASLGPAGKGGEISDGAEVSAGLQAEGTESVWDDHSLLLIVGEGDTFEDLQLTKGGGTSGHLVREHATDALPEHTGGGLPVLVTAAGVSVNALLHSVQSNDLVSLEGTRLENLFTPHNGNSLSLEKFLGNNTGKTALKVTSSVND